MQRPIWGRRVIVVPVDVFGATDFLRGDFGMRIDGFEGEQRAFLDRRNMFCAGCQRRLPGRRNGVGLLPSIVGFRVSIALLSNKDHWIWGKQPT